MFTWSLTGRALWFAESTPRVLVPGRMSGTQAGPSWRTLATPLRSHCCPLVTVETKGSSTFWFGDRRNRGVSITAIFFWPGYCETNRPTLVFSGTSQLWWGWTSGWWLWSLPRTIVASSSCKKTHRAIICLTWHTLDGSSKIGTIQILYTHPQT